MACFSEDLVEGQEPPPEAASAEATKAQPGCISKAHAEALLSQGFAVVDDFLDAADARLLREEAVDFARSGRMPAHKFQFGASQFVKPHIFEADLHSPAMQEELPRFTELLFDDTLAENLQALLPEAQLSSGPKAKSLKLQHNAGSGGCFPCHYDNAGRPSCRAISCVVYLNPEWKDGDGGELVLSPFLQPEVVVPPLMGRAALFRSDRVLHRVLPASKERFCFTIWLDGGAVNRDEDCNLTARHLSTDPCSIERFMLSPVQRSVSRAVYAEEYEESLRSCMADTAGGAEMLQEHRLHVARQRAHPQLGPFIEALREIRSKVLASPRGGAKTEAQA